MARFEWFAASLAQTVLMLPQPREGHAVIKRFILSRRGITKINIPHCFPLSSTGSMRLLHTPMRRIEGLCAYVCYLGHSNGKFSKNSAHMTKIGRWGIGAALA